MDAIKKKHPQTTVWHETLCEKCNDACASAEERIVKQSLEDSTNEGGGVGCRESSSKIITLELSDKNMFYSV